MKKEIIKIIFISLIVSLFLEVTVFNFRHYESLFFKNETVLDNYEIGKELVVKIINV